MNKLLSAIALSTLVLSASSVYAGEQIGFSKANHNMKKYTPKPSYQIKECSKLTAEQQEKDKTCSLLCQKGETRYFMGSNYTFYPANCGIEPNHDTYYYVEKK